MADEREVADGRASGSGYSFRERRAAREAARNDASSGDSGGDSGIADGTSGDIGDTSEDAREPSSGAGSDNIGDTDTPVSGGETAGAYANDGSDRAATGREEREPILPTPGKRGRHPRGCECPRHSGGGSFSTEGTETGRAYARSPKGSPESVNWSELFGITPTGKRADIGIALAGAYKLGFDIAGLNWGTHWRIAETEAKHLGKVSALCLNTVPAVTTSRAVKRFEKFFPWLALIATAYVIAYPRWKQTQLMEQMAKNAKPPEPYKPPAAAPPPPVGQSETRANGASVRPATEERRGAPSYAPDTHHESSQLIVGRPVH